MAPNATTTSWKFSPAARTWNADLPGATRWRGRWGAGSGWSSHPCRWWPTASGGVRRGQGAGRVRRGRYAMPWRSASCGSPAGLAPAWPAGCARWRRCHRCRAPRCAAGARFGRCGSAPRPRHAPDPGARSATPMLTACRVRITSRVGGGLGPSQPALQPEQGVAGQAVHPRQRVSASALGALGQRQRPDHQLRDTAPRWPARCGSRPPRRTAGS